MESLEPTSRIDASRAIDGALRDATRETRSAARYCEYGCNALGKVLSTTGVDAGRVESKGIRR